VLEVGRRVLRAVGAEFGLLTSGDVAFEELLETGDPSRVLVDLSHDADLVVLAHRPIGSVRRLVTMSTAMSVAAHAACPVVAVPAAPPHRGGHASGGDHEWITVGVHEDGLPEAVIRAGFEAASSQHSPLRVVHAWRVDGGYDDIILRRVGSDWEQRVEAEVRTALQPLETEHPDVKVDVEVRHQWPADALVELADSSKLLVVGRHGHRPVLPQRLGSIARSAVQHAPCPVMVVPVPAQ
jgi:nucleotide-binding universal stress UspA family protein